MTRPRRILAICVFASTIATTSTYAQGKPTALAVGRFDTSALRIVDAQIDSMKRSGDLRTREIVKDTLLPDRQHERLDQYVRGVRIVGGDVTRQFASDGTVSVFGMFHDAVDIDTTPRLSTDGARAAIATALSGDASGSAPELVILPLSDGYHLAYAGRARVGVEIVNVYVDANSGALLQRFSEFISEIGTGVGAYGDQKKLSVKPSAGAFVADDGLRPAAITTYDMKGDLTRTTNVLNVVTSVAASDIASDADNNWTDSNVVDSHVYTGWYYDFLFKRFGRNGLDNNNLRMPVFVHPVRIQDIGSQPTSVIGLYYLNAFSCGACGPNGRGAIVLGEGAPNGSYYRGIDVKPFSAALDVVAHELTHQVTSNTARLNGFQFSEAGALNEGFSDIFGVSTAFYYLPAGNGPMQASYFQGKDLTVPSGFFGRSMSNPQSTGDPDHYSQRIIGFDSHYNSTILSHAFYLAIEGGTNRTSGLSVQGVGATNRDQIEKSFFRALTVLLPSSATYALARATTIQAARDLYGTGSAAERAVTQAWDAVGVQPRTTATAALLPNPASSAAPACSAGLAPPTWLLGVTVSAGSDTLRVSQWALDFYDHLGRLQEHDVLSATNFAQFFTSCGPGNSTILAQSDACSAICVDLSGDTSGAVQMTVTATNPAGSAVTITTPRASLVR
ncbi:MAG TPA: M4 family metallopeptidase [Vicinamibacterales bacterium]|nr:M4 family metallopeptidase [Vicinamibacterales bacterium]